MNQTKSYDIPKRLIYEAYKQVKANKGSVGIDAQSLKDFERNLENNLYKLWSRMSSGSYFPQAVKRVEIPKVDGGMRPLGIPAVADRIVQSFDFLGFMFRSRLTRFRNGVFLVCFLPAISQKAAKRIRTEINSWPWKVNFA